MLDAITFDAVRSLREYLTTKLAELLTAVNAGKGIKSVQRGVASGSTTMTITAVDMSKAFITVSASSNTVGAPNDFVGLNGSARLISATQVNVESWGARVCWEVVEFK